LKVYICDTKMEITQKTFESKRVRVVELPTCIWFCGKDIAKILGYGNSREALKKHVDDNDRSPIGEILTTSDSNIYNKKVLITTYINKRGISTLISRSRTITNKEPLLKWLRDNFDISYCVVKKLYREEQYISNIIDAFSHLETVKQYSVGSYRIDLYFPEHNLAIECDEFGHADRDAYCEQERELYIRDNLGCEFIRFNPDSKKFNIFKVINRILQHCS
jgi:very-short-patch-repair endonuclease